MLWGVECEDESREFHGGDLLIVLRVGRTEGLRGRINIHHRAQRHGGLSRDFYFVPAAHRATDPARTSGHFFGASTAAIPDSSGADS